MPLSESATPVRNSLACACASPTPSHAPPGATMTSAPITSASSQREPSIFVVVFMPLLRSRPSIEQGLALAAVQRDHRAVHEAGALGRHEHGDVRDLLRRADAAEGNADLGPLLRFRRADVPDPCDSADQAVPALCGDRTRIDRVDAD